MRAARPRARRRAPSAFARCVGASAARQTSPAWLSVRDVRQGDVVGDRALHQQALRASGPPAAARRRPRSRRAASAAAAARPQTSSSPRSRRSAPKIARASSERPLPISPARPRISPARISNETPLTAGARRRSRTESTTGASAGGLALLGEGQLHRPPEHRRDEPLGRLFGGTRTSARPCRRGAPSRCPRARAPPRGSGTRRRRSCRARAARGRSGRAARPRPSVDAAVGSSITTTCALRATARSTSTFLLIRERERAARARPPGDRAATCSSSCR